MIKNLTVHGFILPLLFALQMSGPARAATTSFEIQKEKKSIEPPCLVTPTLSLLEESALSPSRENYISAAWFARAVQLETKSRNASWEKLSEKPKSVYDLYAGPFGLHATILDFESSILIMYRGTQDPLDYVLNALFYTSPGWIHDLPGWVHNGFLTNFGLTWRKLRSTLGKINGDRKKNLVFASHSLGGAMSQYAAWRLSNDGYRVSRIYAFQSPNSGDHKFKREFDGRFSGRTFNLLYGDDITPYIPPSRTAVDAFAAAATRPLSGVLKLIAKKANYEAVSGRYELLSDGVIDESNFSSEELFWGGYREKSGGKGFPLGLSPSSSFVSDHNIDRVLCKLATTFSGH